MPDLSVAEAVLIGAAGFVAGSVNAVAGGGSLLSFPALLAVGYPSLTANVTNTTGLWPGYLGSVAGFRKELGAQQDRIRLLVPAATAGAVLGSVLLLTLPSSVFDAVVPFLVLLACLLLAIQPRVQKAVVARTAEGASPKVPLVLATFGAATYGAYFGGGLGVILLAVLGSLLPDDLKRLNAVKALLALVANTVALIAFALFGPVAWAAVAVVAPASLAGGYLGAGVARRLGPKVLRTAVIVFGVAVALRLLTK